jgi:hypothetical protein
MRVALLPAFVLSLPKAVTWLPEFVPPLPDEDFLSTRRKDGTWRQGSAATKEHSLCHQYKGLGENGVPTPRSVDESGGVIGHAEVKSPPAYSSMC